MSTLYPYNDLWEDIGNTILIFVIVHGVLLIIAKCWDNYGPYSMHRHKKRKKRRTHSKILPSKAAGNADEETITMWKKLFMFFITHGKVMTSFLRRCGTYMTFPQIVLDMFTCIFFVHRSYNHEYPYWMRCVEGIFQAFFMLHFVQRLLDLNGTVRYLLRLSSILDMLAIVSTLYSINHNVWVSLAYLRAVQMRYQLHNLNWSRLCGFSQFTEHLVMLATDLLISVFMFASSIFLAEFLGPIDSLDSRDPLEWNFINSVYFIFITISTVGYGDIAASTIIGRLMVVVFVIVGIVIFSSATSKLVALTNILAKGQGKFTNQASDPYLILCGSPSMEMIRDFLSEVYHSERLQVSQWASRVQVVLLLDESSNLHEDVKAFISRHDVYHGRVILLVGSPLKLEDLQRVRVEGAEAIFLMNQEVPLTQMKNQDTATIFRSMSIMQYSIDTPLFMLLSSKASERKLRSASLVTGKEVENIAFADQLKMSLFGLSCVAPGFATVIFNLVKSRGSEYHDNMSDEEKRTSWLYEYLYGAAMELYVLPFRREWIGFDFRQAALKILGDYGIIVLGITLNDRVFLNPTGVIPSGAQGLFVAESEQHAFNIAHSLIFRDDTSVPLSRKQTMYQTQSRCRNLSTDDIMNVSRTKAVVSSSSSWSAGVNHKQRSTTLPQEPKTLPLPQPTDCVDHIVLVCFNLFGIEHFLRPLRSTSSSSNATTKTANNATKPAAIVIVCPEKQDASQLENLENLDHVFYYQGVINEKTMYTLSMEHASRIIILSSRDDVGTEPELRDADVVFIMLRMKKYLRDFATTVAIENTTSSSPSVLSSNAHDIPTSTLPFMLSELQSETSIIHLARREHQSYLLDPQSAGNITLHDAPSFASGEVLAGSIAHMVLIQTYYNRNFLHVIETLIENAGKEDASHISLVTVESLMSEMKLSSNEQLTFAQLYEHALLSQGVIIIGLLRNANHIDCILASKPPLFKCGGRDAPSSYVYTCPMESATLCPQDLCYVLSQTKTNTELDEIKHDDIFDDDDDKNNNIAIGEMNLSSKDDMIEMIQSSNNNNNNTNINKD